MSDTLVAGARIGGYRIVRLLGEGGVGAVHEAVHESLEKRVAIKTLHASALASPDAVQRFVREGKIASKIRHPHVVDVTDVGVDGGTPYLVMEFLDGLSLGDFLEGRGALPLEALLEIALPVADALAAAHDEGIVHRDLKPDNVFLVRTRSGELHPKLLDFGISKVESVDARLTATTTLMGTPYYMSPEQARGAKNVDARSDQFSFGLVLYEMATGRRPVDGDSLLEVIHRISNADIPALETLRPELPDAFLAVVARSLAVRADDRFASMRELGAALLPLAGTRAHALWERSFAGVAVTPARAAPRTSQAGPTAFASTVAASGTTTPLASTIEPDAALRPRRSGAVVGVVGVVAVLGLAIAALGPWSPLGVTVGTNVGPPTVTPNVSVAPTPDPAPSSLDEAPPSPEPAHTDVTPTPEPTPTDVAPTPEPAPLAPPTPSRGARRHTAPATPAANLPVTLTPEDVNRVLLPFNRPVAACNNGPHGIARVALVIEGATGRISAINITGPFTTSSVSNCIAGVLHTARFPRFASPSHAVMFPYSI